MGPVFPGCLLVAPLLAGPLRTVLMAHALLLTVISEAAVQFFSLRFYGSLGIMKIIK